MVEKKLKRPLALKLIFLYSLFSIPLSFILLPFYIIALYYGLWKMRKDWMWSMFLFLILSTITNVYNMFISFNVFSLIFIVLNIISIYWLYTNRNIFKEPEKGSVFGTKSEWIRVGLIIFGIVIMFILGAIKIEYLGYGILALPIWIIFVWFGIPKLLKKR